LVLGRQDRSKKAWLGTGEAERVGVRFFIYFLFVSNLFHLFVLVNQQIHLWMECLWMECLV
jgi:hypothetical protein